MRYIDYYYGKSVAFTLSMWGIDDCMTVSIISVLVYSIVCISYSYTDSVVCMLSSLKLYSMWWAHALTVSILPASVAIIIILIPEHADSIHNVTAHNGSMSCHIILCKHYWVSIIQGYMAFTGAHGKVRGYSLHVLLHEF